MTCDANRNLWVITYNGDLHLYNDTWQLKSNVERSNQMWRSAIAVAPNGDIYVGGDNSLYRSTNGGTVWDTVVITDYYPIEQIVISNSGEVYFASMYNVYVPDSNSSSWRRTNNNGVFGRIGSPIALAPNGTLYATEINSYGTEDYIIRSTDAGNSWLRISPVLPYVTALTVIDNNIFIFNNL
jgi:photosystem II stability/assembly factor-like uncharacterized protein